MTTITITSVYKVEGQLEGNEDFVKTQCGKIINKLSGRVVKQVRFRGLKGYYLAGKFTLAEQIKTKEIKTETKA